MRETYVLPVAGAFILMNGYIGHHFAPHGITFSPIFLTLASMLIVFGSKLNTILKSTAILAAIILNDYLVQKYSGGIHDSESFAWTTLYLFFGLILCYIILIIGVLSHKDTLSNKLISILVFPAALFFYMFLRLNIY